MKIKTKNNQISKEIKRIAISEILILLVSIVAFGYLIGEEFELVSADDICGAGGVWDEVNSECNFDIVSNSGYDAEGNPVGNDNTQNPESPAGGLIGIVSNFFTKNPWAQNLAWAGTVYSGLKWGLQIFGVDSNKANAAANAGALGIFIGRTITQTTGATAEFFKFKWIGDIFGTGWTGFTNTSPAGWIIGSAVAITTYLFTYKKTSEKTVILKCNPYEAERTEKNNCEKCNKQGIIPCSEYQCKSLGLNCELINAGTTEQKCVYVDRKDTKYPVITPWEEVLLEDYDYSETSTTGTRIINKDSSDKCLKANTPFTFGLNTDEPAKCKIDIERKETFDEMLFDMDANYEYNHTYLLKLFSPDAINAEEPSLKNDGTYQFYIRCIDSSEKGNYNTAEFVIKLCVESGPDGTAPEIYGTNLDIYNKAYVANEQESVDVSVYTDEPATCKWSTQEKTYDEMENTMTNCKQSIFEMNADLTYSCLTTLTGLKDNTENKFYFKCKDTSGNLNKQSHVLTIYGTEPLIIDSVSPNNGTIKDSTTAVKVTLEVETSAGAEEGIARCYYSDTGDDNDYVQFFNTDSYEHSTDLNLQSGDYEYHIKCIDAGGNSDTEMIEFEVETDNTAPTVVRVFYNGNDELEIITSEEAECVYSKESCNYLFNDGLKMSTENNLKHSIDWNTNSNYYIRCQDDYGNQPASNECNIILRPFSA